MLKRMQRKGMYGHSPTYDQLKLRPEISVKKFDVILTVHRR